MDTIYSGKCIVGSKRSGMRNTFIDVWTLKKGVMNWLRTLQKIGFHDGRLDSTALFLVYRLFAHKNDEETLRLLQKFAEMPSSESYEDKVIQ